MDTCTKPNSPVTNLCTWPAHAVVHALDNGHVCRPYIECCKAQFVPGVVVAMIRLILHMDLLTLLDTPLHFDLARDSAAGASVVCLPCEHKPELLDLNAQADTYLASEGVALCMMQA